MLISIIVIEMRQNTAKVVDVVKAVITSFVTTIIACSYRTARMIIPVWCCGGEIPNFVDSNAETQIPFGEWRR